MKNYDFVSKINTLFNGIKSSWERLLLKYNNEDLTKNDVRSFKSNILIPTLDSVTDLTALIIERKREDLYKEITSFFKNVINLSSYYQRQTRKMGFNLSSQNEHLSCLLPGYEATVRMNIAGSIAVSKEAFDFISMLGDEQVIFRRKNRGEKQYCSIYYYPWYEDGWGAGSLTTFFEDAKLTLEGDEQIKERYFSLIDDSYIDTLCQFNFLQCLKVEISGQNNWKGLGFPCYPNFARYYFSRVEDIIQKFIEKDSFLLQSFSIDEDDFREFFNKYVEYTKNEMGIRAVWLDHISSFYQDFLSNIGN